MLIRYLDDRPEIIAGDETILREVLRPRALPSEGRTTKDEATKDERTSIRYSLAHAIVPMGKSSRPHKLRSTEVYYILQGEGEMHIGDESAPVRPGHAVYIPPGARQYIRNTGVEDLKFLCIVDPAWQAADEEVD